MKRINGLTALGTLVALLALVAPLRAAVAAEAIAPGGQPPAVRAMTDTEKAAAGCVISSVATMGVVYTIGPSEFVMAVVGGMIVPSSSPVLFVGLFSTIAGMACGAGAVFTPAVLWGWRHLGTQEGQQPAPAGDQSRPEPARPDSGSGRAAQSLAGGKVLIAAAPSAAP